MVYFRESISKVEGRESLMRSFITIRPGPSGRGCRVPTRSDQM
jgi:hypothetical protein